MPRHLTCAIPRRLQKEPYVSRTTIVATRAIALDYLRKVAPRSVGPTEIIKNAKSKLSVSISFQTLRRALDHLTQSGEVEQTEQSRWRYRAEEAGKVPTLRTVR